MRNKFWLAAAAIGLAAGCSGDKRQGKKAAPPPEKNEVVTPVPAPEPGPAPSLEPVIDPSFATVAEAVAAADAERPGVAPALEKVEAKLAAVIAPHASDDEMKASVDAYFLAIECGMEQFGERFLDYKRWVAATVLADDAALMSYIAATEKSGPTVRLRSHAELQEACK